MTAIAFDEIWEIYSLGNDCFNVVLGLHDEQSIEFIDRKFLSDESLFLYRNPDELKLKLNKSLVEYQDMIVLALFAAFEEALRDRFANSIDLWKKDSRNKLYKSVLDKQVRNPRNFRISDIIKLFKPLLDIAHTESINKLKIYRDWIAHGKGGDEPEHKFSPRESREMLATYLIELDSAI